MRARRKHDIPQCGRILTVASFVVLLATRYAAAQDRLQLGASITRIVPTSEELMRVPLAVRPNVRIELSDPWWLEATVEWYETDVPNPFGPNTDPRKRVPDLGRLHVTPIMAGVGYTVGRGRAKTTWSVLAGPAWSRLEVSGRFADDYLSDVRFVVRPGVGVSVRVGPRLDLTAFGGYVLNRPYFSVSTQGDDPENAWTADTIVLSAGIRFGIL